MVLVADVATVAGTRVPLTHALKEAPRPLVRDIPAADPYPIDALSGVLGEAVKAIQEKTQTPAAICAQSVLGAATLAVQAHADVMLPTTQTRPLSNYFLTVAASGERKSSCDSEALWPIRKREKYLREQHGEDLVAYLNDKEAWDAQRKHVLTKNKELFSKKMALEELGPEPNKPLNPMLTLSEPTYEGLVKLFAVGQPSLGLYSAEGGQFIGGHGMSQENKLRTATGLSSLWDGEPIKRVRAGDGAIILPGCRFSLHLMVQPDVASIMLSDRALQDQGLLSRLLVAAPVSGIGTRFWREPSPEADTVIKRYGAQILDILESTPSMAEGSRNELSPRTLPLSIQARQQWIKFSDHIERQVGPDGDMAPIRGLASKLAEHASRIAGVLTLIDDLGASEIPERFMAAGIILAQFYASEAHRLFSSGAVSQDLLLAQKTLGWLQTVWHEDHISLRALYQMGPNAIRTSAKARMIVEILEEHGWLERLAGGSVVDGSRSNDAWHIVREA